MATIQLTVPDDERDHFAEQARQAGKPLDAWLLDAARQHAGKPNADAERRFKSPEELQAFFQKCETLPGPEREPDWEEHLKNIDESRRQGQPTV